jgi:hypothetical protein
MIARCWWRAAGGGRRAADLHPLEEREGDVVGAVDHRRVHDLPGVISDCHCSVQLNHFIPGFLSYSVAVFLK